MKKLFVLMIAMMIIAVPTLAQVVNLTAESGNYDGFTQWGSPWGNKAWVFDFSDTEKHSGDLSYWLHNAGDGSFGAAYAFATTPGNPYTVGGFWKGTGANHWVEVLFFNDDGRPIYDQCDAPSAGAIVAKHDGWGLNGGNSWDWQSIVAAPVSGGTLTKVATGTQMYVVIKAGASGGNVSAYFDDITVSTVPEPSSMLALLSGIGAMGFGLRRRIR